MINKILIFIFTLSCASIRPINQEPSSSSQNSPQNSKVTTAPKSEEPQSLPKVENLVYKTKTFENSPQVKRYCDRLDKYFKKYEWGKSTCHDYSWNHVRSSFYGNPIIWFVFGDESLGTSKKNVTFIECGVHGDEITPIKFCYDLLEDLKENPQIIGTDKLVVVAPLVTPDSFFKEKPTRTNARGVDINRNFPTKDWNQKAISLWKSRYHSDKRRYPGKSSLSEQETIFQVNIIKRYDPNKVISIHAPLTLLDYDGPHIGQENGMAARELLESMSDKAGKYKVSNYPFFTGSLGNWAGNERNIPTYTLELPNSDWHKTDRYYALFREAIFHAIGNNLQ